MSDNLAVGRLRVQRERPYYSAILWALQPVPVKDFAKKGPGPIGVDQGLRLYYDPEAIDSFKEDELAAILCHEIGHVIRRHAPRCGDRKDLAVSETGTVVSLWNIAGDLEINDDLQAEGLKLPGGVFPKNFKLPENLMAEEYYDLLQKQMAGKPSVKVPGKGGAASGQCGSVADGQKGEHEQPDGGTGTVPPAVSEAEQELMRQRVAEDVVNHVKNRGNAPSWLERWAKERLKSKVDWRRHLRALVRRAVGDVKGAFDYTYTKPGRRSGALRDFVWPSLRQPTPRIHIQVDTSGSMSEKELAQALAEIEAVLTASGQRGNVTVSSVDAAVHTTQKVFKTSDVKLMGGGGTDMTLGLLAAEAMRPKPHIIILVTDTETGWPDRPLSVPLIVARTSSGPVPEWARVVDVIPDAK